MYWIATFGRNALARAGQFYRTRCWIIRMRSSINILYSLMCYRFRFTLVWIWRRSVWSMLRSRHQPAFPNGLSLHSFSPAIDCDWIGHWAAAHLPRPTHQSRCQCPICTVKKGLIDYFHLYGKSIFTFHFWFERSAHYSKNHQLRRKCSACQCYWLPSGYLSLVCLLHCNSWLMVNVHSDFFCLFDALCHSPLRRNSFQHLIRMLHVFARFGMVWSCVKVAGIYRITIMND